MRNQGGFSLGFGFVCFKLHECALKALAELNGQEGLYVKQALKKTQRVAEIQRATDKYKTSMLRFNLYFKDFPVLDTTEEELKEYFSQFGELRSLRIMRRKTEAVVDPIISDIEVPPPAVV